MVPVPEVKPWHLWYSSAHPLPIAIESDANSSPWLTRLSTTITTALISEIRSCCLSRRALYYCCLPTSLPPPTIVCTVSPAQKAFLLRNHSYPPSNLDCAPFFGPRQCPVLFSVSRARRGPHEVGAVPVWFTSVSTPPCLGADIFRDSLFHRK